MKRLLPLIALLLFAIVPAQRKMKDYKDIMNSKNIYEIDAFLRDAHEDDPRRAVLKPRLMELINEYIKTAHPEDQQIKVLQQKLVLLNDNPSTKIDFQELKKEWKTKEIERYKKELQAIQSGEYKPYEAPKDDQIAGAEPTEAQKIAADVAAGKVLTSGSKSFSGVKTKDASNITRSGMTKSEENEFNALMNETADEHKDKTVKVLNALFDNDPNSKETTVVIENKSDCNIIVRIEGVKSYKLPVLAKSQNTVVVEKGNYLFNSVVCNAKYTSQKTIKGSIMVSLSSPK